MYAVTRFAAVASVSAILFAFGAHAVRAQPATDAATAAKPDPNAVVAQVGDAKITERDLALAADYFKGELARVPEAQKRQATIEAVVNLQLLAQAGRDAKLDKTEDFASRLAFLKLQALRNAYVRKEVIGAVTDADLKDAYQKLVVAPFKPEEEVHARHILVDTKAAAEKIIADLAKGASFEELAKKESKDATAQNGGDLGFFGHGQMVKAFEDAAFAMKPGEISKEPVKSKYGWHVIKVEGTRMSTPPAFKDVKAQLANYLMSQRFDTVMSNLQGKYKVEIVGEPKAAASPDAGAAAGSDAAAPSAGAKK